MLRQNFTSGIVFNPSASAITDHNQTAKVVVISYKFIQSILIVNYNLIHLWTKWSPIFLRCRRHYKKTDNIWEHEPAIDWLPFHLLEMRRRKNWCNFANLIRCDVGRTGCTAETGNNESENRKLMTIVRNYCARTVAHLLLALPGEELLGRHRRRLEIVSF